MDQQNVLIAGCGYVGIRLGLELAGTGARVWGLRRSAEALPAPITPLVADLLAPEGLARVLPEGLGAVVYAAAASSFDVAGYRRAYVEGLQNLIEALRTRGCTPSRLVFCSSTGVYGQSSGEWVDEASPTEPSRATGAAILEGERIALAAPWPATVLRFSGIYGPSRARLVEQVRDGTAERHGDPPRFTNRIHRDDCAGALAHVLALEHASPLYLASDSEPAPHDEVLSWIAQRLGIDPPPFTVAPASSGRVQGQNKRCSNGRLLASGYALRYPTFREGYAALTPGVGSPRGGGHPER